MKGAVFCPGSVKRGVSLACQGIKSPLPTVPMTAPPPCPVGATFFRPQLLLATVIDDIPADVEVQKKRMEEYVSRVINDREDDFMEIRDYEQEHEGQAHHATKKNFAEREPNLSIHATDLEFAKVDLTLDQVPGLVQEDGSVDLMATFRKQPERIRIQQNPLALAELPEAEETA